MNFLKIILGIMVFLFLIYQVSPVCGGAAESPEKYALVIGINDYINLGEDDGDLLGCENDAQLMKSVLVNYYGFKEENVILLLSQEATKEKIREAFFSHLVNKCKEGDTSVFFYSGHGSQVEDLNGDESDSCDEALCPADIEMFGIKNYIIDDEFGEWIGQVKTDNFTIILDSCFSGTATKEGEKRLEKFNTGVKFFDSGFKAVGGVKPDIEITDKLSEDKYALISGCASDQVSEEGIWTYTKRKSAEETEGTEEGTSEETPEETEGAEEDTSEETFRSGVLTRNLVLALSQANTGNITFKDIMTDIITGINYQGYMQKPGIEGNYNRFVFQDSLEPSPDASVKPYFHITGVEGNRVQLDGGFANGVELGSIYEAYSPDEIAFSDSGTGKIEIDEVSMATAGGKILEGSVEKNGKVVQVAGVYSAGGVVFSIDNQELKDFLSLNLNNVFYKVDDANIEEIRKEINDDKKIEILKLLEGKVYFEGDLKEQLFKIGFNEEEAGIITAKTLQKPLSLSFTDSMGNVDFYIQGSKDEDDMIYIDLYDKAGWIINSYSGSFSDVFDAIRPFIDNTFALNQLFNLSNSSPDFKVKLWTERDNPVYMAGEEITYYFEAEKDCYLTLIDVATDGTVTVLFPNNITSDSKIEGGKTYSIPAEGETKLTVEAPMGIKMVKAIATENSLELEGYIPENIAENFIVMPAGEGGSEFVGNISMILAKSIAGGSSKSMEGGIIPLNDWATAELVIPVREY